MQATQRCPEDVLAWIPWYPDDGLGDLQRGAVEAHAASCARCRRELGLISGELEVADPPDMEAVLGSVLTRVREADFAPAPVRSAPRRSRPERSGWQKGAVRVLMAACFAALCGGIGALAAIALRDAGEPIYTTATAPPGAEVAAGPVLDVVFRNEVDADGIRAALRAVNGQIVAGPTELGRYRVRLGAGADARAAAHALASGDAGVAVYAEPAPR
jgi:hypothetical protein